jgi:predicted XRE-type DNA-binding protein
MENNIDIREAIKKSGLKQWEVAEKYGIHEGNFSRRLRHELRGSEKTEILKIINDLHKRQKEDA